MHSHTQHSKENLAFLPLYIDYHTIPIVGPLFHKEMKKYRDSHPGKSIDFSKAYWTPPMSPEMVLESETRQIEDQLGMQAFVSITDHDTIAGPLGLQANANGKLIPDLGGVEHSFSGKLLSRRRASSRSGARG